MSAINAISDETFPADYVDGFVKQCMDMDLNEAETEALFRVHANNAIMADPAINSGFREIIGSFKRLKKSAMLRYLTPEMLALSMDCQIRYGNDLLSQETRAEAGLPEPSWDTVPDHVKAAALVISEMEKRSSMQPGPLEQFDSLPLQQKVLLASLFGGVLGGAGRAAAPKVEDQANQRGVLNRFSRGALRGAMTGAGAAAGENAGAALGAPGGPEGKLIGMTGGTLLGGIGGHQLADI